MKTLIRAAAVAVLLMAPAVLSAQDAPSPFLAINHKDELQLTPAQLAQITVARDSLREAHRIHCAPMHATTPSPEAEAKHHEEMAVINARWEGQARASLTQAQQARLAQLAPAPAASAEHHDEGHHGGGSQPAAAATPAPAAPAQHHSGHHPRR